MLNENTKNIFDNYEAFYNALVSCTALSNDSSDGYRRDAKKIVDLICKAYALNKKTRDLFASVIFDTLEQITTLRDCNTVKQMENLSDGTDEDVLLYMKCNVIEALHFISTDMNYGPYPDRECFNYQSIKPYHPNMRYFKINRVASYGIVVATRQTAIMQILGIGCEQDLETAERRLISCAFWGDTFSLHLLAELKNMQNDAKEADRFKKLAEICDKYLYTGCTVLPKGVCDEYGNRISEDYALISTILQDVVYAFNLVRIDFSFIEAINSPELDYYQRMKFINDYKASEWKEVTNSSTSPTRKIGF